MDIEEIRAVVRRKLGNGELPREECRTTWGGSGSDRLCQSCERPTRLEAFEFECELPDGRTIFFCRICFVVWGEERRG
jgi:hypothetical protein